MGERGGNSSWDFFIAISTANPEVNKDDGIAKLVMPPNEKDQSTF